MNSKTGTLFVVATPIGNFSDISERALDTLASVSLILAEDTRQARKLTGHFGIDTAVQACHEHNEEKLVPRIVDRLTSGEDIALISDAGTPLISDPGYRIVREARSKGLSVSPIPGASAFVAALSASGLPTDRFLFEGFLPAKSARRRTRLEELRKMAVTVVVYESSHRIIESLADMEAVYGSQADICIGREITKKFESFYSGLIGEVREEIAGARDNQKGEFVVILSPGNTDQSDLARARALTKTLAADISLKKAAKIAADTFGVSRNDCYRAALDE